MKLNDAFNFPQKNGIFSYINHFPWDMDADQLNVLYHYNHSGHKTISPMVASLLSGDELSEFDKTTLGNICTSVFYENWEKRWNVLHEDYAPLNNYDMTETETVASENSASTSGSSTSSSTLNRDGSDSSVSTAENSIYGFNSVTGTKADSNQSSATVTHDTTDTTSENASNSSTASGSENITRNTRRFGNLGVTTSQQMASSELELRKFNFYESVMEDIDTILTIGVYCL